MGPQESHLNAEAIRKTHAAMYVINMAIFGTDCSHIDKAGGYLLSFTKVSPFDYMNVAAVAAK